MKIYAILLFMFYVLSSFVFGEGLKKGVGVEKKLINQEKQVENFANIEREFSEDDFLEAGIDEEEITDFRKKETSVYFFSLNFYNEVRGDHGLKNLKTPFKYFLGFDLNLIRVEHKKDPINIEFLTLGLFFDPLNKNNPNGKLIIAKLEWLIKGRFFVSLPILNLYFYNQHEDFNEHFYWELLGVTLSSNFEIAEQFILHIYQKTSLLIEDTTSLGISWGLGASFSLYF